MNPPPPPDETAHAIRIRGARVHNLRDLDVDIPRDKLVVLTGVSGSGKSSLAFDTIHAEGRRRYIEGLSSYARQFLDQLEPPDVDAIDGLPPTVSIDQGTGSAGPRSTVGTLTEVSDYLRLLYARAGLPHCPRCRRPIRRQAPEQIVSGVLALKEGRKVLILAPMVRNRKGLHAEAFAAIRREGLLRARVDGEVVEIADPPPKLAKAKVHTIEAVVDRLVVREGIRPRLAESVDRALKLGDGTVVLSEQDDAAAWQDRVLSTRFACPECAVGLEEIEPRTFSFNSPLGACPACDGLGIHRVFDPELVLADRTRAIADGAVAVEGFGAVADLPAFLKRHKLARSAPLDSWPAPDLDAFFAGEADFPGLRAALDEALAAAKSEKRRAYLETFRNDEPCPSCHGARLRPEALAVTIAGRSIDDVGRMTATEAHAFFEGLDFAPPWDAIGPPLVREVVGRLGFLERVGLDYLSLGRRADTLSGGEWQRVRLAAQIGVGLVGACYVLDEPTGGLHPRDTDRLIASLKALRDAGNSVLVVEHDEPTIRAADWLIDLGPGAGPDGGKIVAQGPPGELIESGDSATARHLQAKPSAPAGPSGRLETSPGALRIVGATMHNLKGIDATFPLGCITCVTGVSGSGKSTLVGDILAPAVRRHLGRGGPKPGPYAAIEGLSAIDSLVEVDQTPIGRSPRSTPATFTGVFDEVRRVFALTREAKVRGYKPNRFSFNVKGGRCDRCAGQGVRKVEMQFLPDLYVTCESCHGKRFNPPTLEARYKGKSIGDVLEMRADEAAEFFAAVPRVLRGLDALRRAGLGYVTLGQSSTTLSGGEAQRVKLAAGLGRIASHGSLYILDEPTTGLHFADVANLLQVLESLASRGATLVVIEHNLEVIRAADWILDLGPEGGPNGGRITASGTPEAVAATPGSVTGRYLAGMFGGELS